MFFRQSLKNQHLVVYSVENLLGGLIEPTAIQSASVRRESFMRCSASLGVTVCPLSGGKGVHVVVPLVPEADWTAVKGFCQNFAELLAKTDPERFVANMSKARRKGRMFLDYLRNGQGSTAIYPWSTGARPGGTVAVPVAWEELDGMDRGQRLRHLCRCRTGSGGGCLGGILRGQADVDGADASGRKAVSG